jgi:hypothetical protein
VSTLIEHSQIGFLETIYTIVFPLISWIATIEAASALCITLNSTS